MTRVFTESDRLSEFAAFIDSHPILCDDARVWMQSYGDISLGTAFEKVLNDNNINVDWCTFVIGYFRPNINKVIRQYCIDKIRRDNQITINLISSPLLEQATKTELLTGVVEE